MKFSEWMNQKESYYATNALSPNGQKAMDKIYMDLSMRNHDIQMQILARPTSLAQKFGITPQEAIEIANILRRQFGNRTNQFAN